MKRILPLTLLLIAVAFGFYVNSTNPVVEVITDNSAMPPNDPVLFPTERPMPKFSDFDVAPILETEPTVNMPPNDDELPDYPQPFVDEEAGIEWDGEKVEGWDDGAPVYDAATREPTMQPPEIYFAPFVGIESLPPGAIVDPIDPNDPGCPDMDFDHGH